MYIYLAVISINSYAYHQSSYCVGGWVIQQWEWRRALDPDKCRPLDAKTNLQNPWTVQGNHWHVCIRPTLKVNLAALYTPTIILVIKFNIWSLLELKFLWMDLLNANYVSGRENKDRNREMLVVQAFFMHSTSIFVVPVYWQDDMLRVFSEYIAAEATFRQLRSASCEF